MQIQYDESFSEFKSKKISLSQITQKDIDCFEILNKYLIDHIATHYDDSKPAEQENQELYTFKIPRDRHRTLDYILSNILGFSSRKWDLIENSYTNHKYKLVNGILNIIVKKNVTKDTHLLFETTANNILALQNLGLTRSQALTSRVIETVGQYNLLVEERRIKSKIITNKTDLKKFIVARIQHQARLLQPIERCICDYKDKSAKDYYQEVERAVQNYTLTIKSEYLTLATLICAKESGKITDQLIENLKNLHLSEALINKFLQYDTDFLKNLAAQLKAHLNYATNFLKESITERLTPTQLSNNLQSFLFYQLNDSIDYAQAQNDLITASSDDSLFRGKLRDILVDTDVAIRDYTFDQINPITKEHQADFRTLETSKVHGTRFGENKVLYQSTFHAGRSKEDQERVLVGICALEERHKRKMGTATLQTKAVKSASWSNFSSQSKGQKAKRLLAWVLTTLCQAPLGIANIFVTAVSGQAPVAHWMQSIEKFFTRKFKIRSEYHHDFEKYCDKLGGNNLYTTTLIGRMFHRLFREITSTVVHSPRLMFEKLHEQGLEFAEDIESGLWSKTIKRFSKPKTNDEQEILLKQSEASGISLQQYEEWVESAKRINSLAVSNNILFKQPVKYAHASQPLDPYHPHDLISSLVNATVGFVDFFKDGVFEKHPVTAFIATLAYVLGGSAVMTPAILIAILTKAGFPLAHATKIVIACQAVGKPIAKAGMSQAIASGFTLAKIMGVSMNASYQGFDSALAKIIQEISKKPLLYTIGIFMSYGFGALITDIINIPGVTDYFSEEIGTVPALGQMMIGAKLGMISLEAALPEDEEHPSIVAEFIADMTKNMMILFRVLLTPLSLSSRPFKDAGVQLGKGAVIVAHGFNKLTHLFAQMIVQPLKTFLEVGTTLYANTAKLIDVFSQIFRKKKNHAVPTVGTVFAAKHEALQAGTHVSFFFREHCSREPARYYSRLVKEWDKPALGQQNDYNMIAEHLKGESHQRQPQELPDGALPVVIKEVIEKIENPASKRKSMTIDSCAKEAKRAYTQYYPSELPVVLPRALAT